MLLGTTSRTRATTARVRLDHIRRMLSASSSTSASGYREPERPAGNAPQIEVLSQGRSRTFTLNRPEALNALSWDMFVTMGKRADAWREDPDVTLVLGLGAGRAFAAGGDIKAVVESARTGKTMDAVTMLADSFRLNWKMAHLGKPYVAFMDGIIMGGGAGVAFPADIRIATRRTLFAMPEQRIGYSPDFGGSYFMNQLDGAIGTWLAVTGRDVLGREAYELGIASHYVAEESVPELAARLAQLAADKEVTPEEISAIVAEYHVPASRGPVSRSNPDGRSLISGDVRAFLDATFSLPSLSAIYAALSAAEADTSGHSAEVREWAREQRAIMDTRGPTGMAVAVENYALARAAKRFATTLELDIVMGTCFAGSNRASEDLLVGAVHALFEKHKTPIPFSPPITDLGNAFLRPEAIRRTFLTRESPHAHDSPPMDVGGGLVPLPTGVSADALWGKFRKFGIPSEDMVREVVESGASAEKVVQKLVKNERRARRDEFEAAVRRILTDHTKTVDGGLRQVA